MRSSVDLNPFNSLSDELLLELFAYLDLSSLIALSEVDKRLLNLTRDEQVWKKKFQLHFPHRFEYINSSASEDSWFIKFAKTYMLEYRGLPANIKNLYTLLKENKVDKLKKLFPLELAENEQRPRFLLDQLVYPLPPNSELRFLTRISHYIHNPLFWVLNNTSQDFLDHLYQYALKTSSEIKGFGKGFFGQLTVGSPENLLVRKLCFAIVFRQQGEIAELIQQCIPMSPNDAWWVFAFAAMNKDFDTINLLTDKGVNFSPPLPEEADGMTVLRHKSRLTGVLEQTIEFGHLKMLKFLFEKIDPSQIHFHLLMESAGRKGELEIIEYVVNQFKQSNLMSDEFHRKIFSACHEAILHQQFHIISFLLTQINKDEKTGFYEIFNETNLAELIKTSITYGSFFATADFLTQYDVNFKDYFDAGFDAAEKINDIKVAKFFIEQNPDIAFNSSFSKWFAEYFSFAVQSNNREQMTCLLEIVEDVANIVLIKAVIGLGAEIYIFEETIINMIKIIHQSRDFTIEELLAGVEEAKKNHNAEVAEYLTALLAQINSTSENEERTRETSRVRFFDHGSNLEGNKASSSHEESPAPPLKSGNDK